MAGGVSLYIEKDNSLDYGGGMTPQLEEHNLPDDNGGSSFLPQLEENNSLDYGGGSSPS